MKYIKGLDSLRAFAVLCVIVCHWFPKQMGFAGQLLNIFSGDFGVDLFFVLSGFLITSILLNERKKSEHEPTRNKKKIFKGFFLRRMIRIFPIYYLTIIIFSIFSTYGRDNFGYYFFYLGNVLPYRTNQPNPLSHTWSLSVEEQFYLVWPWFILLVKEKYLKYVFVVSLLLGIVSKYVVLFVLHHRFACLTINCLDAFAIGGLYAYMKLIKNETAIFEKYLNTILIISLFFGVRLSHYLGHPIAVVYSHLLDSLISIKLIIFVLKNKNVPVQKYILENKVLNYIGKISYGLYLYHFVMKNLLDDSLKYIVGKIPAFTFLYTNPYALFFTDVLIIIGIASLSYYAIEEPILRLKKKVGYS